MALHTLTFSDWDHYTDGDGNAFTLDWTPANMIGKTPYPFVEAIRQAVLERDSVSNRGVTGTDAVSLDPCEDPIIGGLWMQRVLREAMAYIWTDRYFQSTLNDNMYDNGYFQWVAPSAFSTMHNLKGAVYKVLTDKCYSGGVFHTAAPISTVLTIQNVRETLLDDAGVSDSVLRAWWLSFDKYTDIYDGYPGTDYNGPMFLLASTDVLWSIKGMLNLLTYSFETRRMSQYITTSGARIGPYDLNSIEYKQGESSLIVPEGTLTQGDITSEWSTTKSDFNSNSWQTAVYDGHYCNLPGYYYPWPSHHGFQGVKLGADYGKDEDVLGQAIYRYKIKANVPMFGDYNRSVELGMNLLLLASTIGPLFSGRPRFTSEDFSGVTEVPTQQYADSDDASVFATTHAFSTYAETSDNPITFGDYGNATQIYPSEPSPIVTHSTVYAGWTGYGIGIIQDFDVTDGFTFR